MIKVNLSTLSSVRWTLLSLLLMLFLMIDLCGCQDNTPVSQQKRVRVSNKSNKSSLDITRYTKPGTGPLQAPEWVSAQEPNMMRLFSHQAVSGFRNGHAFTPKMIFLEYGEQGWKLILNEKEFRFKNDLFYQGQRIEIPLNSELSSDFKQTEGLEESRASWKIPTSQFGKTYQWNSQNAHMLEILEWQPGRYDPKGPVFQTSGHATGRLMIHFKDEEGIEGWAFGRFEKISIRYLGNPRLWKENSSIN